MSTNSAVLVPPPMPTMPMPVMREADTPEPPALPTFTELPTMTRTVTTEGPAAPSAEPASDGLSAGTTAGGAATTGPAPAGAPSSGMPSMDELVRRLFDPLSARLKAELRLDRERAGLVTDLRR